MDNTEKQLRRYIIPNILAMACMSIYILADTIFISIAEGADGITALNLVLPVYSVIYAIGGMTGIGAATRFSLYRAVGSKDADKFFANAIEWNLIFSVFFIAIGILCPEKLLEILGGDENIIAVGTGYMRLVLLFAPCFMINYVITSFVRNDGAPKIAMTATIVSSLFNIAFDYILMFPAGMGIVGAALATGLSPIVSMIICLKHFLSPQCTIKIKLVYPSAKKLVTSCSLGIVAFVGEIASGITTMSFNFILLSLTGNIGVAAYGVIANTALVGTSLFNGIAQGLQPMASEAHGRSEVEKKKRIYRHSLLIAMITAVCLVSLICIFANECVALFNSENSVELSAYAVPGIRIYFIGFILAAVNIVKAGFLSATDHSLESSAIAVLRGIIAIVAFAFVLSKLMGITGVWLSFPASEGFTLIATLIMDHCLKGKQSDIQADDMKI